MEPGYYEKDDPANGGNIHMKRREFLTGAAVAGMTATGAGSLAAPAYAQGKQEWKLVTTWPRNAPVSA